MVKGAGPGSTLEVGKKFVTWLRGQIKKRGIKSINDAGCGRVAWCTDAELSSLGVVYSKFDLDPEYSDDIIKCDITQEAMPRADLIICKDVFRHLDLDQVKAALALFDAKHLVCDTDPGAPNEHRAERPLDMEKLLGKPISKILSTEKRNSWHEWHKGKYFALWKLEEAKEAGDVEDMNF